MLIDQHSKELRSVMPYTLDSSEPDISVGDIRKAVLDLLTRGIGGFALVTKYDWRLYLTEDAAEALADPRVVDLREWRG